MLLKVMDQDRVKVLIEEKDVEEYRLNPENLNEENAGFKEFLLRVLHEIYSSTGVNFLDCKVMLEIVPGAYRSYYIIISRLSGPVAVNDSTRADGDMYLFELANPESIFDIAGVFEQYRGLAVSETRLYKYRKTYYLAIVFPPETVSHDRFRLLLKQLTEYCQKCRWNLLNEALLEEWGELIARDPVRLAAAYK